MKNWGRREKAKITLCFLGVCGLFLGCETDKDHPDSGDGNINRDGGSSVDSSMTDAGIVEDSGSSDGGANLDAGSSIDGGMDAASDAGGIDSGMYRITETETPSGAVRVLFGADIAADPTNAGFSPFTDPNPDIPEEAYWIGRGDRKGRYFMHAGMYEAAVQHNFDVVLLGGDNAYDNGTVSEYRDSYDLFWGQSYDSNVSYGRKS